MGAVQAVICPKFEVHFPVSQQHCQLYVPKPLNAGHPCSKHIYHVSPVNYGAHQTAHVILRLFICRMYTKTGIKSKESSLRGLSESHKYFPMTVTMAA